MPLGQAEDFVDLELPPWIDLQDLLSADQLDMVYDELRELEVQLESRKVESRRCIDCVRADR